MPILLEVRGQHDHAAVITAEIIEDVVDERLAVQRYLPADVGPPAVDVPQRRTAAPADHGDRAPGRPSETVVQNPAMRIAENRDVKVCRGGRVNKKKITAFARRHGVEDWRVRRKRAVVVA